MRSPPQSGLTSVNLVHVSYAGVDYVFDSDNTSYQITTEYGVLEIHDDGAYEYSTFAANAIARFAGNVQGVVVQITGEIVP